MPIEQQHYALSEGNIHRVYNWDVATITDRDALVVSVSDIGKICKVGAELFWLASITPATWVTVSGGQLTFLTEDLSSIDLLTDILKELVKANFHLAVLTGEKFIEGEGELDV